MSFVRILSFIHEYALWLYGVGALVLLFSLYELREAHRNSAATIFSLEKEFAGRRQNRLAGKRSRQPDRTARPRKGSQRSWWTGMWIVSAVPNDTGCACGIDYLLPTV